MLLRFLPWLVVVTSLVISLPGIAQTNGWEFPATSTYSPTFSDNGKVLSTENVPGGSITISLPTASSVGQGWQMGFSEANGRGIVFNAPFGVFILSGQKSLTSITVPSNVNYEYLVLQSDGTNFRVTSATDATARYNGIFGTVGGQAWVNLFSTGYSSVLTDNGSTLTSKLAGGPVTVTLPSTPLLPNGWAVTFYAATNPITLQLNGVSGGSMVSPQGQSVTTYTIAGGASTVSFDGAAFHVMNDITAQTPCQSIALYGGVADGSTDNAAALTAALAAQGATKCVSFPPGKFKFASTVSISVASPYGSLTMMGSGQGVTELIGPSSSGVVAVTLNSEFSTVNFHDMSVEASAACSASACKGISVTQSATTSANGYEPPSYFTRMSFYGTDRNINQGGSTNGTNYWATGIYLNGISNVNFDGVFIQGIANNIATATQEGVWIDSTNGNVPVVFNFHSTTVNSATQGILLSDTVQGVTVSQGNFTNDQYGIYQPSVAGPGGSQLTVSDSQFACQYGVYINAIWGGVLISNNLFLIGQVGGPPFQGIVMGLNANFVTITGNVFAGTGGAGTPNAEGILLASTAKSGIVTGNEFSALEFGVVINTNAAGWVVNPNHYVLDTFSVVNNTAFGNVVNNFVYGGVPSVGSGPSDCGTGAIFQGSSTDQTGGIQVGTSPGTLCTVTFSKPFLNQPFCIANNDSSLVRGVAALFVTTTGMQISSSVPLSANDFLAYHCDGWQ